MNAKARQALARIQQCLQEQRFIVLPHFLQRLAHRGLFWPDIEMMIDAPANVRFSGLDNWSRPRWIISGSVMDGSEIDMVCVLDAEQRSVVFVTVYWSKD